VLGYLQGTYWVYQKALDGHSNNSYTPKAVDRPRRCMERTACTDSVSGLRRGESPMNIGRVRADTHPYTHTHTHTTGRREFSERGVSFSFADLLILLASFADYAVRRHRDDPRFSLQHVVAGPRPGRVHHSRCTFGVVV